MNSPHVINAKNIGIVLFFAAAATVLLMTKPQKIKQRQRIAINNEENQPINNIDEQQLIGDLQKKRELILTKFEDNGHRSIPSEMNSTLKDIEKLNPRNYNHAIRLLGSQIIQDYAIMYSNIHDKQPEDYIIQLAKQWLDFTPTDTVMQVEQINHRYALSLRSRSIKEFSLLYKWLKSMDANIREQKIVRENWILRCFQCSCLLGYWKDVKSFGMELEKIEPETLAPVGNNCNNQNPPNATPLHPLHLFEYIALKLPNQSANFTQVYYNCESYLSRFDPLLNPPLKFSEWQIKFCTICLKSGTSTIQQRQFELNHQIKEYDNKRKPVKSMSKFMFVYGCLAQFPCYWVQIPANNNRMQPVVLTGPWNDAEMELTASYVRRLPQHETRNNIENDLNNNENKEDIVSVVRSDLRLKLDRKNAYTGQAIIDEIDIDFKENNNNRNNGTSLGKGGWQWAGTFEHNEGILEIDQKDLASFDFRKNLKWEQHATNFTTCLYDIEMIICTPD